MPVCALRLTIKEKRRLSPTLSGSPQAKYTMVQSAPIGTNPIVYSFARFYFEVVIRERLSKYFHMSCIQVLPKCSANIMQASRVMQIYLQLFYDRRSLYSTKLYITDNSMFSLNCKKIWLDINKSQMK